MSNRPFKRFQQENELDHTYNKQWEYRSEHRLLNRLVITIISLSRVPSPYLAGLIYPKLLCSVKILKFYITQNLNRWHQKLKTERALEPEKLLHQPKALVFYATPNVHQRHIFGIKR